MLKKHRKNTFFMALIVGISAISLATLGYSVWIAGIQNKEASTNTSVTMDFATNNTVIASVTSSKSRITIDSGEVESNEKNPLGRPSSETSKRDLSYPIQMELITSNNAIIDGVSAVMAVKTKSKTRPDLNIVPTFKDTGNGETDKTLIGYTPVKIKDSDTTDIFGRNLTSEGVFATNYTFLSLNTTSFNKSLFIEDSTYSLSGYSRYTYTDNNFGFKFGTFFGGKEDPERFYNHYILQYRDEYLTNPTAENKNTYLRSIQAATDELNLMYRLMNGSTINVTFTANVTFNNQQP